MKSEFVRRKLPTGQKAHLLTFRGRHISYSGTFVTAICGTSPRWYDPIGWVKADESVKLCQKCAEMLGSRAA